MSKYSPLTANRLREAMLKKNLTAQELSDKSGVGKSSISQYLSGKYTPKNVIATKLGSVLNVDPEWLMGMDNVDSDEIRMKPEDFIVTGKEKVKQLPSGEIVVDITHLLKELESKDTISVDSADEERILKAYRSADDLTKAMVRRTLGIE